MRSVRFGTFQLLVLWTLTALGPNAFPAVPGLEAPPVLLAHVASVHVWLVILGVCAAGALAWAIVLRRQFRQHERAELRLLESEALYQSLLQNLPASVLRKDREGRVVFGNQQYVKFMGRPLADLLGKTDFDLFPKDLAAKHREDDEQVWRSGEHCQRVECHQKSDGEARFVEVWKSPVRTAQGDMVGVQVVFWDVTERERAKQALSYERDLLDTLLQNIPDRVYFKDRQSRFVKFSKQVATGLQVTDPAKILGKTDFDFFTDEHARPAFEDEQRIMRTGQPVIGLVERETWQGGLVSWVLTTKMPWRAKTGEIIGTFGLSKDITELKNAEIELAYERGLFRTLLDTTPDYIYFKDTQSRFVQVSRSLAEGFFHLSDPAQCRGKTDFNFLTEAHARPAFEDEQQILRTGQPILDKLESETHSDGRQTWVLTTKMPWRNPQGEIIGTFGVSRDITAVKQAEAELAYERGLFRTLLDTIPDYIYFKDTQSRFVQVSRSLAEHYHLDDGAQCKGKTDFDYYPEDRARPAFEDEQQILRTGQPILSKPEKETGPDGRLNWILTTKMPWRNPQGEIIGTFGISKDITAAKQAEAELAYERELFRTLLDTMPDAIYFKDRQSRCVRVSRAFAAAAKLPDPAQAEGKTDFDFFTDEHARPAFEDEQHIIQTAVPMIGKLERETHPDGRITWALTTKMPWRAKTGEIVGIIGVSRDISDLKHAEERLEQTHRQLLQISRQAGMAEVATGVLHNVGNVLNSVNVSSNLICDRLRQSPVPNLGKLAQLLGQHAGNLGEFLTRDPRGQQVPAFLEQLAQYLAEEQTVLLNEIQSLIKNVQHINEIVAMQQNYARVVGIVEQVNLEELIEDALRMNAGAYFRHQIEVVRDFAQLPPVRVERHRVLQILVNLLSNAKYACDAAARDDKRITVRTRRLAQDHTLIEIADNGIGIPAENLTRIFGHGFTTRNKGHGFGLHTSALAAKALGGCLSAASDGLGRGATFKIELPLAPPPSAAAESVAF